MSGLAQPYPDLHIRAEIIGNVRLPTFFLAADVERLKTQIPHRLKLHPSGRLILNTWYRDAHLALDPINL